MKGICVKCKVEMRPHHIGVMVVHRSGLTYSGDILKCPACGLEICLSDDNPKRLYHVAKMPGVEYLEVKDDH